jgi:hypothetical protein
MENEKWPKKLIKDLNRSKKSAFSSLTFSCPCRLSRKANCSAGIISCKKCGSIMTVINSEEDPQKFLLPILKGLMKRQHRQRSILGRQYSQAKKPHTKVKNAKTAK